MTKPKKIAKTLKATLDSELVKTIQDKTSDIYPVIDKVKGFWGYDLYSRKPGLAYKDGVFVGTDLDLAAFLFELVGRNAVLNIPEYKSMRQTQVTEGRVLTSKQNRHGKLVGLVSNQDTFVFSIRIEDMNVITVSGVGEMRTFSLTDFDGSWYDGWDTLQFIPTAEENEFVLGSGILLDNSIVFKNFIHPNRWTSFYGQYYFITKLLIERLVAEAAHLNKEVKRMLNEGVTYPSAKIPTTWAKKESVGESKKIVVDAFEAVIDFPEDGTEFPTYEISVDNLVDLTEKRKKLVYTITPYLRFMTRATEQAFSKHIKKYGLNSMPSWLGNVKWEEGYVAKGKRTAWNRLVLFQPAVGQQAVAIRFRSWTKSEKVNSDYVGVYSQD